MQGRGGAAGGALSASRSDVPHAKRTMTLYAQLSDLDAEQLFGGGDADGKVRYTCEPDNASEFYKVKIWAGEGCQTFYVSWGQLKQLAKEYDLCGIEDMQNPGQARK